jgi:glycerophosphoryl diester phosphodiesterase
MTTIEPHTAPEHERNAPVGWLIGHRGARARRPENTLAAVDYAVTTGLRAIEVDLRLSEDGVLVCAHDAALGRMYGSEQRVSDLSAEQLAACGKTPDVSIPNVDDVLDRAYGELEVVLELKSDHGEGAEVARELGMLLTRRRAAGRDDRILCVSSFDHSAALAFRDADTVIGERIAFLLTHRQVFTRAIRDAHRKQVRWIHAHYSVVLREPWAARMAKWAQISTAVYTVNDPAVARCVRLLGVDRVISDEPDLVVHS